MEKKEGTVQNSSFKVNEVITFKFPKLLIKIENPKQPDLLPNRILKSKTLKIKSYILTN